MKFAMKEALVLTIPDGGDGPDRWRLSSRFVFYIDTDAEKIAFIDWYTTKLQVTDLFQNADTPFRGLMANFPNGSSALYFECEFEFLEEHGEDERVFPLGSDANKLALFELIDAGELCTIFGGMCSCGLEFNEGQGAGCNGHGEGHRSAREQLAYGACREDRCICNL